MGLLRAAWVGATLICLSIAMPINTAQALNALEAEMAPLDADIAFNRVLLAEIDRQAQARVQYISGWIEWWTSIKTLASETATAVQKNYAERIENAEKAQALLASLYTETPDQQRNVPHFGWQNAGTMAVLIGTLKKEQGEWAQLFATGKAEWHYVAAGWITGEGIQGVIDAKLREIEAINEGVRDGSWTTHIGGIGWVTVGDLRRAIEGAEKRKAEIQAQVAAGDYAVCIPGFGTKTRNGLEAEIAAAEAEVARRRAVLAAGEMVINHPAVEWKTLDQLRARLDDGQKAYDVMKATVNDGLYTLLVVDRSWAKRIDLEDRIQALEGTISTVQQAIAGGEYRADTPIGWVTRQDAENAVKSIGEQLNNPALEAKAREYLSDQLMKAQKALTEIQAVSAYDLLILGMEKQKFAGWATSIMKLARPDFEQRERTRADIEKIIAEYPLEGDIWIKQAEALVTRLRAAREWIPG